MLMGSHSRTQKGMGTTAVRRLPRLRFEKVHGEVLVLICYVYL